jgi:hypothetical protein
VDNAQAEAIYCCQVHVLDLDRIDPGVAGPDDEIPHQWVDQPSVVVLDLVCHRGCGAR